MDKFQKEFLAHFSGISYLSLFPCSVLDHLTGFEIITYPQGGTSFVFSLKTFETRLNNK